MFKPDSEKEEALKVILQLYAGYWSAQKNFRQSVYAFHRKDFDYVDHEKLWIFLKEMAMPQHLTVLMRHL